MIQVTQIPVSMQVNLEKYGRGYHCTSCRAYHAINKSTYNAHGISRSKCASEEQRIFVRLDIDHHDDFMERPISRSEMADANSRSFRSVDALIRMGIIRSRYTLEELRSERVSSLVIDIDPQFYTVARITESR